MQNLCSANWYVLYTYPKAEKKANKLLLEKNFDVFLPLINSVRQWKDRKKRIQVPLFPNYLFIKINEAERWSALNYPGIIRFLGFSGKPSVVPSHEIDFIRSFVRGDFQVSEGALNIGRKVKFTKGALMGIEGVLTEKRGEKKLVVQLQSIEKTVCISVTDDILACA